MTGPVCYLERAAGGALIRRVRLVSPGGNDRSWIADAGPDSGPPAPAAALSSARAAARWVFEQLGGPGRGDRSLRSVCLDADGGLCVWLSAPSGSDAVVAAAMVQGSKSAVFDQPEGGEAAASAGPLAAAADGAGFNRSIQALAERNGHAPVPRRSLLRRGTAPPPAPSLRMGVLSVPDAPARVFLDELDALGVAVERVESLWHAVVKAWDPGADHAARADDHQADLDRDVATMAPCSAVVVADPSGRLVWGWSSGGDLIAAGTIRVLPADRAPAGSANQAETAGGTGAARRAAGAAATAAPESSAGVVCGAPEVGRLTTDWLAWSAQLGVSPQRVVCIGVTTGAPGGDGAGGALAAAIVRAWPGATVDAAADPDPIGATLARLAAAPERAGAAADDPRRALVALTNRPGRAHRRLYQWLAVALLAGSVAVAVLGWRLRGAAEKAAQVAGAMRAERATLLEPLESLAPGLVASEAPEMHLRSAIARLQAERGRVELRRPVLAEFARVLDALAGRENIHLDEINIYQVNGLVLFSLDESDLITGPTVTQAIQDSPGEMDWRGEDKRNPLGQAGRQYQLTGTWPTERPRPAAPLRRTRP